jgi:ornithine decarboxylase
MEWLHTEGVRFDCASGREIRDVLSIHEATSNAIIFANPHKTLVDMALAKDVGIERTVVDSPEEVDKIARSGWRPDIVVRLAVDDAASRSPFSIKFGAEKGIWHDIMKRISANGLSFCGLSFHIGSASGDPTQYKRAIQTCKQFVETVGTRAHVIDIGGGFMAQSFAASAKEIRAGVDEMMEMKGGLTPKEFIAEPGRFFSAITHTLYAPIMARKAGPHGKGYRYVLDESIYGQFSCIPFDHAKPDWVLVEGEGGGAVGRKNKDRGYLFGRTCDSIDLIAYSEKMDVMKEGDWLCFPSMGAYTTSSSSEFNGFPKPKTYYQNEGWIERGDGDGQCVNEIIYPVEAKSTIQLSV